MTSESDGGIWPPYEAFYIEAMLFNTRSAMASINWISDSLERVLQETSDDPAHPLDKNRLLDELQNLVQHAAALSRYFWPVSKGHNGRARHLRQALDVTEDKPLRSRDLRNAMEHLDEKLDTYLANGIAGHIFPEFFGVLSETDGVPVHMFRAYYLNVGLFEMLGKRYEIEPIANEIMRLHERLLACRSGRTSNSMKIGSGPLTRVQILQEIPEIAKVLLSNGIENITVYHGWGAGLEINQLWEPIRSRLLI
jgi:hypothetical protein